jgi:hypothetical protein
VRMVGIAVETEPGTSEYKSEALPLQSTCSERRMNSNEIVDRVQRLFHSQAMDLLKTGNTGHALYP